MLVVAPQPDPRSVGPYQDYGTHQAIRDEPFVSQTDPYLGSRYHNPLPLPPETGASSSPSPPRDKQPKYQPDISRLRVLKAAEEEATQRREQEQRDLELALQLDKELNT